MTSMSEHKIPEPTGYMIVSWIVFYLVLGITVVAGVEWLIGRMVGQ